MDNASVSDMNTPNFSFEYSIMNKIIAAFLYLPAACAIACSNGTPSPRTTGENDEAESAPVRKNPITAVTPAGKSSFVQGDSIVFSYDSSRELDSVFLFVNGKKQAVFQGKKEVVPTSRKTPVGSTGYRIEGYAGGEKWSRSGSYVLLPAQSPVSYGIRIAKIYPHSTTAYTQGLEFHDGFLYESSGEYGKSYIHRMIFPAMKSEKRVSLEPQYFGEGLTVLNDKLYLLTWESQKGFIYDAATLKREKEFDYATEGWGLTNDGKRLYMSDGSEYIYLLDPETLKTTGRIQVYSSEGPVRLLNELEWIEGEIWANVYGYDLIVRIDPETGAVTGTIDASGLLEPSDISRETDVLNGIAHSDGKIYLTGKNWNKLFEAKIFKK